jgi:hypothetical protein
MKTFSVTYTVKYELSIAPEYVWNEHNECFNLKTGRKLKQVYKNGMIGYVVRGKFISLKQLRKLLVKPQKIEIPF